MSDLTAQGSQWRRLCIQATSSDIWRCFWLSLLASSGLGPECCRLSHHEGDGLPQQRVILSQSQGVTGGTQVIAEERD